MAARLMSSVRFPAKSAFSRARTARRCSPAAKRRPSRSPRSAPATTCRNLIPTPAATARRNSSCTTTSRTSPSAKPAASAGPGRREIGHGALAERSLEPMLPLKDYPYTIRVTSESWSPTAPPRWRPFAAARWRCMDAGVPMIRPVAGISVGICTEYSGDKIAKYQLLTDIIGWEDALLRHGLQDRRHGKGHHRLPARLEAQGPAARA